MKLIVLLLLPSFAFCAFERSPAGARRAGLGGGAGALEGEPWCMVLNPAAAAAGGMERAAAFTVVPAVYGLGGLSDVSALALLQIAPGAIGLSAERFGSADYREITVTALCARSFTGFEAGVALCVQSLAIAGYGSATALGVAAGIRGKVTPQLSVGASARNINAPSLGGSGERLPQEFRAALAYTPTGPITVTADYAKQSGFDAAATIGCEYRMLDLLALRLGFAEMPQLSCAGLGIRTGLLRLDYAVSYHAELGITHVASLSFVWSR